MAKCEICGKETENLFECSYCGRLVCSACDNAFVCDDCLQRQDEFEFFE